MNPDAAVLFISLIAGALGMMIWDLSRALAPKPDHSRCTSMIDYHATEAKRLDAENNRLERYVKDLMEENSRLARLAHTGQPQPVNRAIDVMTSLRLMGLDPIKGHLDPSTEYLWSDG